MCNTAEVKRIICTLKAEINPKNIISCYKPGISVAVEVEGIFFYSTSIQIFGPTGQMSDVGLICGLDAAHGPDRALALDLDPYTKSGPTPVHSPNP